MLRALGMDGLTWLWIEPAKNKKAFSSANAKKKIGEFRTYLTFSYHPFGEKSGRKGTDLSYSIFLRLITNVDEKPSVLGLPL